MKNFLKHIYNLGIKETKSFLNDKLFVLFVIWAFTLNIIIAANTANMDVRNASIAIVDEDGSQLSKRITMNIREPYFKDPIHISFGDINDSLDMGKFTFVLVIPSHFQADLVAGKNAELQLNIDATVMSQAYVGSGYIKTMINEEVNNYLVQNNLKSKTSLPYQQVIRIKYNPNVISEWFMSIAQLITIGTMLSMMLPAVALIREKESGTIEHLLVMPITPQEIMLSKIWSNGLIILLFSIMSMMVVVQGYFRVNIQGSLILFFIGFVIFQFSITSMGMALATFASNTAQLALLIIMVMMPMVFLSGMYTPTESMAPALQKLMFISPLKHCMDFAFAVVFRGAKISEVWQSMAWMLGMGIILFILSSIRFNSWFNSSNR